MSENERAERCETCRFWHSDGRMAATAIWCGYCQRFPPVPIVTQEDDCIDSRGEGCDAYFPITYHENWCGEWQPIGPDSEERQCPKLLYVHEASELLKYTSPQLTRMARRGTLPCVFLPNTAGVKKEIRFLESDLAAWVESHRQPKQ